MPKVAIIGAGYSSLAAAGLLAKNGFEVEIFEKNSWPGGRAGQKTVKGFNFDLGPSWYMMPEVFEQFFQEFDKKTSDYFHLTRLDPSYRIYFGYEDYVDIPSSRKEQIELFEHIEPGAGKVLESYLKDAQKKYELSMREVVPKSMLSIFDLLDPRLLIHKELYDLFRSFHSQVRKYFSNEKLIKLLEWIVVFVGGTPQNIPGVYTMMNYADFNGGIWYPLGGIFALSKAMESICKEQGVVFHYNSPVSHIQTENGKATAVICGKKIYPVDAVISGIDYAYSETKLLDKKDQTYPQKYWSKKDFSPSCLLFYVGLNKKLDRKKFLHHTLFLDQPWEDHFKSLFDDPHWPKNPLFYLSITSITDPSTAPKNKENLFFLVPVAAGLEDKPNIRDRYWKLIRNRVKQLTGEELDNVDVLESYSLKDFEKDFNAYKGHAFGLAHTFWQTGVFRPRVRSKKISNLFYTGCATNPGISMPLSVISGRTASRETAKYFKMKQ